MANKPIIRETLNQYLNLVKQITNQTTNNKMEQELIQLIIKNKDAVKTLLDAHNSLKNEVINKVNELNKLLTSAERSEEHTSELQSRPHLVCRLLLEKKKKNTKNHNKNNLTAEPHIQLNNSNVIFFLCNDTATTEIYTLSLHDALPIYGTRTYTINY